MPRIKANSRHKVFRKDIQALRAFAVVAVVLYHLWPNRLGGGFTGVDIFFVISGYLMTISIMRRLQPLADKKDITYRSVGRLLADFYARRIKRLVPAALTALSGILLLSWLTGNLSVLLTNAKNAIAAATFWQNWFLANDSLNYLQQDNLVVATQHFWSLSLEEQFYLIWPLLLVVSSLITASIVVLYKKDKIPGLILPVILVTLLSLAYGIWLTSSNTTLAYYSTPARIWELMVGGIIALLPAIKHYDLKLLLPHLGLAINLYAIFFITGANFPGWIALLPIIGTALIIWGGTEKAESSLSFSNIFRFRPIQWMGNISYSIYLWHFPLIILLPIIIHEDIAGAKGKYIKLAIIVLTILIAQLSYKYIEQSTHKLKLKTRYVYILFILLTGLVAGGSFVITQKATAQIDSRLSEMHKKALNQADICFGARALLHENKCKNIFTPSMNYSQLAEADVFLHSVSDTSQKCLATFLGPGDFLNDYTKQCFVGDLKSQKTLILFGDSHAEQFINAFGAIGKSRGYRIALFNIGMCTRSLGVDDRLPSLCSKRLSTLESTNLYKTASSVIVSMLFYRTSHVSNTINYIKTISKDKRIVLLQDSPYPNQQSLFNCYLTGATCKVSENSVFKRSNDFVSDLISKNIIHASDIIKTEDMFCKDNSCYLSIGGVPVYYNSTQLKDNSINTHITASYSYSLAPILEQKLEAAGVFK